MNDSPATEHSQPGWLAWGALLFLLTWIAGHLSDILATQNGTLRLTLGTVLALLILRRAPAPGITHQPLRRGRCIIAAMAGLLLFAAGTILGVRQAAWLGVLCTCHAAFSLSLPDRYRLNLLPALFVFYWVHWIPDLIFSAFQFQMQRASVQLSEWLLHMFNVRTWAGDFSLYAVGRAYEVPAACSGMRTATSVFLLALGLGILFRLRRLEFITMLAAAVLQALLLNVIRISVVVGHAPFRATGESTQTLHDAGGLIVLLTLLLVTVEIMLLAARRQRRERPDRNTDSSAVVFSDLPPFWQYVATHKAGLGMAAAGLLLTVGLAYKSRPYHRAEMIKDVAIFLRDTERSELAQQAAAQVHNLQPDDLEWSFVLLRIMVIRGQFEAVLEALETVPDADGESFRARRILKAYCHMGLGQMEDAAAVVTQLPQYERDHDPMIAMVLAELGRYSQDPDTAALHLETAAQWRPNLGRVRSMYPYLRAYRKWEGIVDSYTDTAFRSLPEALCAAEAFMNLKRIGGISTLAARLIKQWPNDPRLLEPLFFLARDGDAYWDSQFAAHLRRCVAAATDIDLLTGFFEKCFELGRPDLAWLIHRRIRALNPDHPVLDSIFVRQGLQWCSFRRHFLEMPAMMATDRIDVRSLLAASRLLGPLRDYAHLIPHLDAVSRLDSVPARKAVLEQALAKFAAALETQGLTVPMHYEFAAMQEWQGDRSAARSTLARLVTRHPEQEAQARMTLSEMCERAGDWEQVYEILRRYPEQRNPQLLPLLRLTVAQMRLKLFVGALHTAEVTRRHYPDSGLAGSMLAAVHMELGQYDEALLTLDTETTWRERDMDLQEVVCLFHTERYSELTPFSQTVFLPTPDLPKDVPQRLFTVPAELAGLWHLTSLPGDDAFRDAAVPMRAQAASISNDFLSALYALWIEAYDDRLATASVREPARWEATGRDKVEKAIALNQLTLLLAWQNRIPEARDVAGRAVEILPTSAPLWRILIGLSHAEPAVISMALTHCPNDPDLWISAILVSSKTNVSVANPAVPGNLRLESLLSITNVRAGKFPPTTLTRAADFLYRLGHVDDATAVMRVVVPMARGYLPSYILGLRCALDIDDREWATDCSQRAINASVRPITRLLHAFVNLKGEGRDVEADLDIVNALLQLRMLQPNDPLWPQILGYVRYKRGGWEVADSYHEMARAIENGATNRTPFIIASDTSRRLGNSGRAQALLRRALELHPGDPVIINNLAYTLLDSTNGAAEALLLVEKLLPFKDQQTDYADTIAWVYFRNGCRAEALEIARTLRATHDAGTRVWFRAGLLQAEAALHDNQWQEAKSILDTLLERSTAASDEDVLHASQLQVAIQNRRHEASEDTQPATATGALVEQPASP